MPPALIVDPHELDLEHPLANREAIRKVLPQRYEMEQLTAIVQLDPDERIIVGYKDVGHDEFWVRGHMPDFPLMPGVLICEAAAQLCCYYITTQGLLTGDFIAFGGMDKVKFRDMVRPGDRLIMAGRAVEIRPGRRAVFVSQGIVEGNIVFHGDIVGMPFSHNPARARRLARQETHNP